jgi:hypothetical protein
MEHRACQANFLSVSTLGDREFSYKTLAFARNTHSSHFEFRDWIKLRADGSTPTVKGIYVQSFLEMVDFQRFKHRGTRYLCLSLCTEARQW